AVRRNSCLQRRSKPSAHRRNGAYRVSTGLFFSSVQPFSLLHFRARHHPRPELEPNWACLYLGNLAGLYMLITRLTSTHSKISVEAPSLRDMAEFAPKPDGPRPRLPERSRSPQGPPPATSSRQDVPL